MLQQRSLCRHDRHDLCPGYDHDARYARVCAVAPRGRARAEGTNTFDDVPNGAWYTDAVTWAAENGVVAGIGNGRFDPDGSVTREQTAVILFNYAQSKGYDVSARADLLGVPGCRQRVRLGAGCARVGQCIRLISGAVRGTQTILDPQGSASRAQVAMILMGYVEHVVNA